MEAAADLSTDPQKQHPHALKPAVHEFRAYRQRFVIVAVFCLCTALSAFIWMCYAAVFASAQQRYHASTNEINLFSLSYMAAYAPASILAVALMARMGLRACMLCAATLNALCALIRFVGDFIPRPRAAYYVALFGQFFAAVAQPLTLNAPARIAQEWLPAQERGIGTVVMAVVNSIGTAAGSALPPAVVSDPSDIRWLLLYQLIPAVLCVLLVGLFMRDKPPTPPSLGALQSQSMTTACKADLQPAKPEAHTAGHSSPTGSVNSNSAHVHVPAARSINCEVPVHVAAAMDVGLRGAEPRDGVVCDHDDDDRNQMHDAHVQPTAASAEESSVTEASSVHPQQQHHYYPGNDDSYIYPVDSGVLQQPSRALQLQGLPHAAAGLGGDETAGRRMEETRETDPAVHDVDVHRARNDNDAIMGLSTVGVRRRSSSVQASFIDVHLHHEGHTYPTGRLVQDRVQDEQQVHMRVGNQVEASSPPSATRASDAHDAHVHAAGGMHQQQIDFQTRASLDAVTGASGRTQESSLSMSARDALSSLRNSSIVSRLQSAMAHMSALPSRMLRACLTPWASDSRSGFGPLSAIAKGMKTSNVAVLLHDANFVWLTAAFAISVGTSWTILTVLAQMLQPCGHADTVAGSAGALQLGVGICSSLIIGPLLQRWKLYLPMQKAFMVMTLVATAFVLAVNAQGVPTWVVLVAYASFGAFTSPVLPITLELAAEMTFPVPADTAAAVLLTLANLLSLGLTLAVSPLLLMPASAQCTTRFTPAAGLLFGLQAVGTLACLPFRAAYKREQSERSLLADVQ